MDSHDCYLKEFISCGCIGSTRIVCHYTRQNHILKHLCQSKVTQLGLHHEQDRFGNLNKKLLFTRNIDLCVVKHVKGWIQDIQNDDAQ